MFQKNLQMERFRNKSIQRDPLERYKRMLKICKCSERSRRYLKINLNQRESHWRMVKQSGGSILINYFPLIFHNYFTLCKQERSIHLMIRMFESHQPRWFSVSSHLKVSHGDCWLLQTELPFLFVRCFQARITRRKWFSFDRPTVVWSITKKIEHKNPKKLPIPGFRHLVQLQSFIPQNYCLSICKWYIIPLFHVSLVDFNLFYECTMFSSGSCCAFVKQETTRQVK